MTKRTIVHFAGGRDTEGFRKYLIEEEGLTEDSDAFKERMEIFLKVCDQLAQRPDDSSGVA